MENGGWGANYATQTNFSLPSEPGTSIAACEIHFKMDDWASVPILSKILDYWIAAPLAITSNPASTFPRDSNAKPIVSCGRRPEKAAEHQAYEVC